MSAAAERIEAARLQFLAARGTPNESQAKAALRDAIDAAIPQIKCSCGETPHTRLCAITQSVATTRPIHDPRDCDTCAALSDDHEPQRLFDVVDVPAFTRALAESNRRVLETYLGMRGIAVTHRILAELADELARNSANVVLTMEIKK